MTSHQKNPVLETVKMLVGKRKVALAIGILAILLIVAAFKLFGGSNDTNGDLITVPVISGDLIIDVLESGSLEASESEVLRSEVEGQTTIISIVPEGTIITEKDAEEGKVLIELDSSDLRDKEVQQAVTVQGDLAEYTDAKESYNIQVNQNESNLKAGELKVKFAKMDLEKYLGERAGILFVKKELDLATLIQSEYLGGEALQKKRELENKIDLAKEEAARASVRLDWTKKLHEKGYVTREDLQADELSLKRREVEKDQAETALELFTRYEFQKGAEKLRSDYEEAVKELERILAKNRAELSKAEAKLISTEASYKQQVDQLAKIRTQIENCTIKATQPGLVVYAGNDRPWRDDQIKEGEQVREQQEIIKIPNTSTMMVKASIHESVIARIHEGQKASITIDSIPDERFSGEVTKVAILPDSQNRWFNPDLKVYATEVMIGGNHPHLKPGMSAQVRIIVDELNHVLMIPLQAIVTRDNEKICFVMASSEPQPRVIETGDYNDSFIEIKKGLKEGERVVLNSRALAEKEMTSYP